MRIASFFEWFDLCRTDSPWLVVGKGPTFSTWRSYPLEEFNVLTLNDAIGFVPDAAVAHFMDWEAFVRCVPILRACECMVVLPWHPHVEFKPAEEDLPTLLLEVPDLASRVVYYHASTARGRGRAEGEPTVQVKFFSAEAALSLLAQAGARVVRTLGIDGGRSYAPEFSSLGLQPLENGRPSFDAQFLRMRSIAAAHKVDLRALGPEDKSS